MLPDIGGLEVIRILRSSPEFSAIPIIVVSAKMEEGKLAIHGDFTDINWLAKPIDEARLLSAVAQSYSQTVGHKPRVLHIEDDVDLHQVVCAMIGLNFELQQAATLGDARILLGKNPYDLIILDLKLPDGSGWHLLQEIRKQQPLARIVVLTGNDTSPEEAESVDAVLLKSRVSPQELLAALSSQIKSGYN